MRGSSNKAELTEQDVCSLTHTVKTVEIKSKQENIKKLKQCECSEASWNSSKKTTGSYILWNQISKKFIPICSLARKLHAKTTHWNLTIEIRGLWK